MIWITKLNKYCLSYFVYIINKPMKMTQSQGPFRGKVALRFNPIATLSSVDRLEVLEQLLCLDDSDRVLVAKRRGDHNRFGSGFQRFLDHPADAPTAVVSILLRRRQAWPIRCV